MRVGLNWWAFNHYGRMFGSQWAPAPPGGAPHWEATLPANLLLFKQMGVSVVRWFILGNGVNYGPPPVKIDDPDLLFLPDFVRSALPETARTIYRFDPPTSLDPQIIAHFKLFLSMFQRPELQGMQVIPSLIDFHFCARPDVDGGGGGRRDVVLDPAKRTQFFDTVLASLLNASQGFEEQIYAWEVMNEPVHCTMIVNPHVGRPLPVPTPVLGPGRPFVVDVPDGVLVSFLQEAISRINAAGFPSTAGHRFFGDLAKFPAGTKPQFHYYAITAPIPIPGLPQFVPIVDPNPIPKFNEVIPAFPPGTQGINRAFVGEIGARIPAEHSTDHGNLWPELSDRDNAPKDILYERLTLLAQKNYELALIWPEQEDAGSDTVASKLKLDKIRGLVRFTGGSFPGI